jgi:hypothetical protein
MREEPSVWLVERQFLVTVVEKSMPVCARRFLPIEVTPSATEEEARRKRDQLARPELYRVAEYRRVKWEICAFEPSPQDH